MDDFEPYLQPDDEEFPMPVTADPVQDSAPQEDRQFEDDLYKKWFRTGSKSGFLSVRPWFDAGKVSVDIGETGGDGLKGNTLVWTNAIELATFLRAVVNGTAPSLYPRRTGAPTPESYLYYGGGSQDGKPISRILKINHWQTGSGDEAKFDASSFVWKCGHFQARKSQQGAFIPDMSKPLSMNLIKVTRKEMAEISYRLDLALTAFVLTEKEAFRALNGNKR